MALQTYWQTSLPGSGFEVTSTLVSGPNVYAASNGYVYRLDSETGQVMEENPLRGRGNYEVRLAISHDGSVLLVVFLGAVMPL
ncbi:hypothetical protein DL93DRAFT_2226971 [Clavulina sp. PMI_390]|nr:hypothetical protein DL93DRAFT_2226971 [Clavulina sp. PMI_390]